MKKIKLGNRIISEESNPYIIAEIGVNHEGSINKAKELIRLAKKGGADAAKFQSYKAEKLASKNSESYWDTTKEKAKNQFQLFKKYDSFNEKDYILLSEYCKEIGIQFVSTPFDENSIDFLDPIMPFYKIASADITNIPFLRNVAKKNKPIILSTGCSTLDEIKNAINEIEKFNNSGIALLHCILNYPTKDENANLRMITHLKSSFPLHIIGYSDHTLPENNMEILTTSYLLGANIIEKHFTDDKSLIGNDHYHAMDYKDCILFKNRVKKLNEIIGYSKTKEPLITEELSIKNARRSIIISKNISKGTKLSESNITTKRPGTGISPINWDNILGAVINKNLNEDHILNWDDIE